MTRELATHPKKRKRKSKMIVRLMIPMLLLVVLQIVSFFVILTVGGEFSYVEQYALESLADKTENRRNHIQSELQQKMPFVLDASGKINSLITELILEEGASVSDLQTDRELNLLIMDASLESLIDLLRRSMANDVYLILDTGSLYQDGDGDVVKAALYLRDLDTMTDVGYEDLLMEIGFSSISQQYGIALDSGWTLHFKPDPEDMDNYDFYYRTIQTAWDNSMAGAGSLGYWSGFSKFSGSATASMKYTVPLVAEDGIVYGVLGIGLTENTILANLSAADFSSETACYVLGRSRGDSQFDIVTHSGVAFDQFIGDEDVLDIPDTPDKIISDLSLSPGTDLVGSVQYINLYGQDSPYRTEEWALISVADRASVVRPLTDLLRMLLISAVIWMTVSVLVVVLICRAVVKPISSAIEVMNSKREYGQIVEFEPTNVYELDAMADAITQLQINVQDFSSQVSKMIRIANVGLGTFMYDRTDGSVFVGQSLLKQLRYDTEQDEDVVMSLHDFLENIIAEETRQAVTQSLEVPPTEIKTEDVREYSIKQADGSTRWMRLSLVHNVNKSIGILQDITGAMMEKRRIEFERDYDITTGLLNRRAHRVQMEGLFRNEEALKVTAVIMIDLDNLKYVNDTYGHDFGDDYIKTAAMALKKFQDYGAVVARLSGDEFVVCLPGFSSRDEIWRIINEVRGQLLQSYCLLADGTHFKIRASMGVAWYPDDAKSYEMLMKYADFAMYTIKHSTKGELAEFDMNAYEMDSVLITGVEEMNRIIDECRVQYAFHSVISAKTGELYGYEALLRPQSSIFQSPLELLRTAKTGAKLYEIERLTWTKALIDYQAQIDAGRIPRDCHIFINSISNCVLSSSDVEAIEKAHPDLLSNVILEILEGENANEEFVARKLNRMKKWNAQIALDDFGTGYNSEYALITMQPNIIKVDRSIINGCDKDVSRRTIINNLIRLARTNQILVLAEGIETEEELKTVISCGVDLLQGYYFNRPLFEPQPIAPEVTEKIRRLAAGKEQHNV